MPTAAGLASVVNAYTIRAGPTKTIAVPNASALAALQDVTVTGNLLKKQVIALDSIAGRRQVSLGARRGTYGIETDGDLHFCLGVRPLQPHITCELQNAKAWLATFQSAVGQPISVAGFFRCLFEHPGFDSNDDAHIFEIHPVRAVTLGGQILTTNVDIPEQRSIHTWTSPHPLNDQDGRLGVGAPATFTLTSPDVGHPIRTICLQGTTAARQLRQLASTSVSMVALRNIDLRQALANQYVINLLAIDIQSGG